MFVGSQYVCLGQELANCDPQAKCSKQPLCVQGFCILKGWLWGSRGGRQQEDKGGVRRWDQRWLGRREVDPSLPSPFPTKGKFSKGTFSWGLGYVILPSLKQFLFFLSSFFSNFWSGPSSVLGPLSLILMALGEKKNPRCWFWPGPDDVTT